MSQLPAAPSAPPCLDATAAFTLATGIAIPNPHTTRAAWLRLPAVTRDHLGALAVDHAFGVFISGDGHELEHRPLRGDDAAECAAVRRADAAEGELWEAIERSLPELFGVDGEDPAWLNPAGQPLQAAVTSFPSTPFPDVPGPADLEALWRGLPDEARDRIGVRAMTWAVYEALQYEGERFTLEAVRGFEHRASDALTDLSVLGLAAMGRTERGLGQ